jgi:hypothetical protein
LIVIRRDTQQACVVRFVQRKRVSFLAKSGELAVSSYCMHHVYCNDVFDVNMLRFRQLRCLCNLWDSQALCCCTCSADTYCQHNTHREQGNRNEQQQQQQHFIIEHGQCTGRTVWLVIHTSPIRDGMLCNKDSGDDTPAKLRSLSR